MSFHKSSVSLKVCSLFQPSEISPENNAFALMFLYVGVQLFGEPRQAREILEVSRNHGFICIQQLPSTLFLSSNEVYQFSISIGVVPLL